MTEKDFQRALTRGLRAQGCFAWPWPDLARAVTKPFDICMGRDGQFLPIECKLTKYTRKKPLGPGDVAIGPANFKGRAHQLPRLTDILLNGQGDPQIAVCVIRIDDCQVVEKRGWMVSMRYFDYGTWTIEMLEKLKVELAWTPNIGWTAPWLPKPDVQRFKTTEKQGSHDT